MLRGCFTSSAGGYTYIYTYGLGNDLGCGQVDCGLIDPLISPMPIVTVVADGTDPSGINPLFVLDAKGVLELSFTIVPLPSGFSLPLQCAMLNDTTVVRLSNLVVIETP